MIICRIFSVLSESIFYYIVFVFLSLFLNLNIESVNIVYFIFFSYISFISFRLNKYAAAIIGLIFSIIISFIFLDNFNLANKILIFFVFYILWYLSVKNMYSKLEDIHSVQKFNIKTYILIFLNFLVSILDKNISPDIVTLSTVYIIISLIVLNILKSIKYKINKVNRAIDISLVFFIILLSFLSKNFLIKITRSTFMIIFNILSYFSYFLRAILIDFATFISKYLFFFLESKQDIQSHHTENIYNNDVILNNNKSEIYVLFLNILILIIIILVILIIFYLITKLIKNIQKDDRQSYKEDREFCFDIKTIKFLDIKNTKDSLKRKLSRILTSDINEKVRYEYYKLIKMLYKKNFITSTYTARNIKKVLDSLMPDNIEDIQWITTMYEQIRYGSKNPTNKEVVMFKEKINIILKNLTNI
ncbi:hypothetical protein SAMN05661008_01608 [Alkalithermobacter thermoalcaliphilus JW-YL-7 = DSM 7308]|uniref:DUF4129 domain-containing protein n=1 Tax=Alkalithermobacter thermoalcaliphilus JW-YL-7 = DSM 7308 TaxID=1121328 RepID=A0A150FSX2_CLOPD|nr:hypothetical protein JWYL7_1753 [[Clostridium] paradoxum JW-YL-7 = DSM 7308]SHL17975.1 hypothetical protein SAMN05661008_01608 [[Clostridium] paradoxum JW-YL-7 = DSM 7308]